MQYPRLSQCRYHGSPHHVVVDVEVLVLVVEDLDQSVDVVVDGEDVVVGDGDAAESAVEALDPGDQAQVDRDTL